MEFSPQLNLCVSTYEILNSILLCSALDTTVRVPVWPWQPLVVSHRGSRHRCRFFFFLYPHSSFNSLFFSPCEIFTQVGHNPSGAAADSDLRAACHAPGLQRIIFLQKDVLNIHLCVIFGSSAFQLQILGKYTAQHHLWALVSSSLLGAEVHPVIWPLGKIISYETVYVYMLIVIWSCSFLFRLVLYVTTACCTICILWMCHEPCKSKQRWTPSLHFML